MPPLHVLRLHVPRLQVPRLQVPKLDVSHLRAPRLLVPPQAYARARTLLVETVAPVRAWFGGWPPRGVAMLAAGTLVAGLATLTIALARGDAGGHPLLAEPHRPVAAGLVRLDDGEGRRLLFDSEAHAAFLPLTAHFETQRSLTHCGLATIAMVLNALEVPAPVSTEHAPYRLFTQRNVLGPVTDGITSERAVARMGMTLGQVSEVLNAYGVAAEARYASASSVERFRSEAARHLGTDGRHVIVNYSRGALGQHGGGHISPLGAYDAESDRFLILDVSRYKAPAVWVETERLFAAMAEPVDAEETRTRGYVLVRSEMHRAPSPP